METAQEIQKKLHNYSQPAPSWVYELKYPKDKRIIESLNLDYFFDWFSSLSSHLFSTPEIFDFYFGIAGNDSKAREFNAWYNENYTKKQCGSIAKRIFSLWGRYRKGLPLIENVCWLHCNRARTHKNALGCTIKDWRNK